MPVVFQKFIYRADLKRNPDRLYLFGDNVMRRGFGGQAKEMRGEPNAIGVATKKAPHRGDDAYFTDDDYESNCRIISNDLEPAFQHLKSGGTVVIPESGLGTGLSMLPEKAPKTNEFLVRKLEELQKYTLEPQKKSPVSSAPLKFPKFPGTASPQGPRK